MPCAIFRAPCFSVLASFALTFVNPMPPARCTFDLGLPDKRGNLFKELNVDLRMLGTLKGAEHASLVAVWAPFLKNMLTALGKMPKRTEQKFYRGRPESWSDVRKIYKPGREVVWSGITSCTPDIDQASYIASWDQGCVLELTLFKVHDISRFSFYPNEKEVLLAPNTKLVVLADGRTEKRTASDGQEFVVKFILMQQVGGLQLIS